VKKMKRRQSRWQTWKPCWRDRFMQEMYVRMYIWHCSDELIFISNFIYLPTYAGTIFRLLVQLIWTLDIFMSVWLSNR
jgi:hypothetical protein